jgi:hypothetical protein
MTLDKLTNGYYSVGTEIYTSKIHAILRASEKKLNVQWHYFDEVFHNVNKIGVGQQNIQNLYKERAVQLRDSYDYLILYYSGGSDSWNILNTFLKHNIKLDCVFVHQPTKSVDKNIYAPNSLDVSGYNNFSEWDLVIKKDLDWLKKSYPEIHIEIGDWTDSLLDSTNIFDTLIDSGNAHTHMARLLKKQCKCKYEIETLQKGKSVGNVYGMDKPQLVEKDNICYFYFNDIACVGNINPENPYSIEYFYCTPKFPLLAIEQAYQLFMWYKQNPAHRYLIQALSTRPDVKNKTISDLYLEVNIREHIAKTVLYPDWDLSKFQTQKPMPTDNLPAGIRQWEAPLKHISDFIEAGKKWKYHWDTFMPMIDKKFLISNDQFKIIQSKWQKLTVS